MVIDAWSINEAVKHAFLDCLVPLYFSSILCLDGSPFPIHPLVPRIKTAITPRRPLRRCRAHVVLGREITIGTLFLQKLEELLVVNDGVPLAIDLESLASKKDAAAVSMLS